MASIGWKRGFVTAAGLALALLHADSARASGRIEPPSAHWAQALLLDSSPLDEEDGEDDDDRYEEGTDALDEERWDDAVRAFEAAARAGQRVDGALYWKAYALAKSGKKSEALAALAELRKKAPQSRWINEGQALELEIRQASGQPVSPEQSGDEELKLVALNALLAADSSKAVPMLESFLASNRSRKLRDRALFVLTQSSSPEARAIVQDVARGRRHADLQGKAIKYLGLFGGSASSQALAEIYASTGDVRTKKEVLNAYMLAGDKERVLAAARSEASPELRRAAVHQLGVMGAQDELWQMYRSEAAVPVKKEIVHAMFIGGGDARLIELSRTETEPDLRRTIVHNLGLLDAARTGQVLVTLYNSDPDPAIRREAVHSLFIQGNAQALVSLARAEKDPQRRKDLVSKLSLMDSKVALDYMMELLK